MIEETRNSQKRGRVGIVVRAFLVGLIMTIAGCDMDQRQSDSPRLISKAEWRQKALPYYNPSGGGRKLTTVADFQNVLGAPSQTQTIEGHAYWYYDCSDGTIQVVLIDPAMTGGQLAIDSINDF